MNLATFHTCLAGPTARGYDLNDEQKEAVDYGDGPLWLLAGPGSGKSEVLVTRVLKLLCVDSVHPRSILLTTFTIKAARNLQDRLATYLAALQAADPVLRPVDLAELRVGTLHSLCNDILQEYRASNYRNVQLLDDLEQNLFAYRYATIANHDDITFWQAFDHAIPRWNSQVAYAPNKWKRVKAAVLLFNHMAEDCISLPLMQSAGKHWATLVEFYQQYEKSLRDNYRCDFAHLQVRFLAFLQAPEAARFLDGDATDRNPPLRHILVDEYQDTNLIQERVYLALAKRAPHNLTVVGDDDQSLYRFRGGNVACMVNFDKACQAAFHTDPEPITLNKNYRSHADIVQFFNRYITSFPEMTAPGVRAPGKPPVLAESSISGNYPAVGWITRGKAADVPGAVADLIVDHLLADGIISDLSQCVLLMRSVRDTPLNAGPLLAALEQRGVPVYNPRAKAFLESEEVQCMLATLVHVVDMDDSYLALQDPNGRPPEFVATVQQWVNTLFQYGQDNPVQCQPLVNYIAQSNTGLRQKCAAAPNDFLNLSLMEILYRILALEPFHTWRQDPSRSFRLAKVTRLFESYHTFNMDWLRADATGHALAESFLNRFYRMFLSYLIDTGVDDDEDEDVIVPQGYLPVMTIHQSKGLEFPFVIVGQLGQAPRVGSAQILEQDLAPFRQELYHRTVRLPATLAVEDDIRLLYVAYSRAEYSLLLAATTAQLKNINAVATPARDYVDFRRTVQAVG